MCSLAVAAANRSSSIRRSGKIAFRRYIRQSNLIHLSLQTKDDDDALVDKIRRLCTTIDVKA